MRLLFLLHHERIKANNDLQKFILGGVCLAKDFIESDYYEKKEINSCDKVERLAPIVFLIMVTIIYPILFTINSPESILPFFSDLFSGGFNFTDIFIS